MIFIPKLIKCGIIKMQRSVNARCGAVCLHVTDTFSNEYDEERSVKLFREWVKSGSEGDPVWAVLSPSMRSPVGVEHGVQRWGLVTGSIRSP